MSPRRTRGAERQASARSPRPGAGGAATAGDIWFSCGLHFGCLRCQRCCRVHDEHSLVKVSDAELAATAARLGLEAAAFEASWCTRERGRRVLRVREGRCALHDGNGCQIYEARPVQCRTWPFWPENLFSAGAWQRHVLGFCHGAGQGRLWSRKEILEAVRTLRRPG